MTADELVEWVAQKAFSADLDIETSYWLARQILSHPDLWLREIRTESVTYPNDSVEDVTFPYYIPLAEAINSKEKE